MIKFEKYLADYVRAEFDRQEWDDIFDPEIFKNALDAFESFRKLNIMFEPHDFDLPCYYWSEK